MTWMRLAGTAATFKLREHADVLDTTTLRGVVLPSDLDFNLHVNNGRYLTLADLGRIDWFLRTGMLQSGIKHRWRPIIATAAVRFSRSLKPWQRYELRTNLLCWGDKWAFMEHRFFARNRQGIEKLFATVAIKGAFQGREGVVTPTQMMRALGADVASPPQPQWITDWQRGEDQWRDDTRTELDAVAA